jgi:hypothetical protein
MSRLDSSAYLGCGDGPHFIVVRPHEEVCNADTHSPQDMLVKVLGLGVGNTSFHGRVNQAVQTLGLVVFRQHGDVVLEWVGHPEVLAAHVGHTLVREPVILVGERLVDAVVKVLVVRENDMAANIVELWTSVVVASQLAAGRLTKPSGVVSVEAKPPGVSFESTISHEGPF